MSKIVNIQNIDPQTFELQTYSFDDTSLISNFEINNSTVFDVGWNLPNLYLTTYGNTWRFEYPV